MQVPKCALGTTRVQEEQYQTQDPYISTRQHAGGFTLKKEDINNENITIDSRV